jgi:hypothetical protein
MFRKKLHVPTPSRGFHEMGLVQVVDFTRWAEAGSGAALERSRFEFIRPGELALGML